MNKSLLDKKLKSLETSNALIDEDFNKMLSLLKLNEHVDFNIDDIIAINLCGLSVSDWDNLAHNDSRYLTWSLRVATATGLELCLELKPKDNSLLIIRNYISSMCLDYQQALSYYNQKKLLLKSKSYFYNLQRLFS